jgi:hypothetical protein
MGKTCAKNGCDRPREPGKIYCKEHLKFDRKIASYEMQNARLKSEERETEKSGEAKKFSDNNQ